MRNKKLHDQIFKYIEDEKEGSTPSDSLKATLEKARNKAKEKGLFITESNIEAYVRGDLDTVECTIIENRMATDPEFAAKVAMEQAIVAGIREYVAEQESLQRAEGKQAGLQETLTTETGGMSVAASNAQQTNPPALRISYTKWLVAATLALLLAAVWFIRPISNAEIFSKLVEKEKKSINSASTGLQYDENSDTETALKIMVGQGEYSEALKYYESIDLNKRGKSSTYWVGMAYLFENNYNKALTHFESIMDQEKTDADFRIKSYFSAALCHFALSDKDQVQKTLQKLDQYLIVIEKEYITKIESGRTELVIPQYISDYRNKSAELKEAL